MDIIKPIIKSLGDTPTMQIESGFTPINTIPKTITCKENLLGFEASRKLRSICNIPYGPIGEEGLQDIIIHLNKTFMPKKYFYAQDFLSEKEKGVYAIKMVNRLLKLKQNKFLTTHLNNFSSYTHSDKVINVCNTTVMDCRSPILEHIMHFPARCKREAINRAISTYIAVVNQKIGPNEGYMPPEAHFVVFYAKNDKDALRFRRIYYQDIWLKIYNTHTLKEIGGRDE